MAKRKKLNLGISDFKDIIQNNSYFVDKTAFIQEVIDTEKAVLLFPRPRRFGKTLNLSMLKYYFDKNEIDNNKLFEDLAIWKASDEVKQHCGRYPVINLSFKDAKSGSWSETLRHIKKEIVKCYRQHRYLLDGETLYADEKLEIERILSLKADIVDFETSLEFLSECLHRYHHNKVVMLVDEYDTPIQAGYSTYYSEVVSFMRNLLSGAFKDNSNLHKGIITGILRVSKESIFSGLNNLSVYSVLDNQFSDKFGFTEQEVAKIRSDFSVTTNNTEIKKWYNGYKFGRVRDMYNPWSILNYVLYPTDGFKTFWTNTSSNELIRNEIRRKDADFIRQELAKLMSGEEVEKDIEENFVFSDLGTHKDLLWTLLLYSGYLTVQEKLGRKKYALVIPNYELKTVFQDTIIDWVQTDIKIRKKRLEQTASDLVNNRIEEFEQGFKEIIGDTFSYYDTVQKNEYVYQAYLLGLLAILGDDYLIKSNKESGEGRYDILLIPHDRSLNGVVIEMKQIPKQQVTETPKIFSERISRQLTTAKEQIDRNKYYKELLDCKIEENHIIKVPIVFAGKEPYVRNI